MVTEEQYKQLKDYGVHLPEELPETPTIKSIRIKPKNRKKLKFPIFLLGLILGFLGTLFLVGVPTDCSQQIEEASQGSYKMGVVDLINYTQQTGLIKYIDGEEIKEMPLIEKCRSLI